MKQDTKSREYKVMLKSELFSGLEARLLEQANDFWSEFKETIRDIVLDTDGTLNKIETPRLVRFYDSASHRLQQNDYIFRERIDLNSDQREITLKFRHPDRYISQDRDMAAVNFETGKTKFEEDIKLPFVTLYSFSTKQPISDSKLLNKMKDPGELYPDLKKRLKSYQEDELINIVRRFTAKEVVITGANLKIGENPKVEAECALIVWYKESGERDKPVVVEFSFKYERKGESFDGETAQKAYDVFGRLKDQLTGWVDPEGLTKTAYVYTKA